MSKEISLEELECIMAQSYNYELIRQNAVKFYKENLKQKLVDISERCSVFFNPLSERFFVFDYDEGIEKYFSYELIDSGLDQNQAILYKKSFVWALNFLYDRKMLCLYDN